MAVCPALRRLKVETADLHLEAERHVSILEPGATLDDYRRYLAAMLGFHEPMERLFAARADLQLAGFAAERRVKSAALRADLAALDAGELPRCAALPSPRSLAHAIGAAYVIEGSTLGGRFILSRLPAAIAPVRGRATRFLDGYGAETGALWRAFGELVARSLDDEAAAVAGARDTFACLIAWLARHEQRLAEVS